MSIPSISVVICTRNRAPQLKSVLDSLSLMIVPKDLNWELLVIDNGSSDNTAEIVKQYASKLPARCVREETPGLSNARNRGVAEALGEYICWTDDDVELDTNWLNAYFEAFKKHPDGAVFGGKIIPKFTPPTPEWVNQYKHLWPLDGPFAYRDLGPVDIALSFKGWKTPYGANYAVRTQEQRAHLYNPALGVSPTHKRVGEETEVIYHILKKSTGYWVPESQVNHIIPQGRQSLKYVYEYFYLVGSTFTFLRTHYHEDNHLVANGAPQFYEASQTAILIGLLKSTLILGVSPIFGRLRLIKSLANFAFMRGMYQSLFK
jgi:glucosyl-dolichyl phosphate glucuronosyltransferase